jgi:hypothetical protein
MALADHCLLQLIRVTVDNGLMHPAIIQLLVKHCMVPAAAIGRYGLVENCSPVRKLRRLKGTEQSQIQSISTFSLHNSLSCIVLRNNLSKASFAQVAGPARRKSNTE